MQPKISIITVCFNSEKHIEEAILSVINQSYSNKEYIIIDGDSKDNTMSIVNKYAEYIDIIVSEKDKGISDAFNKGIRAATGEIICIVNSDDIMPKEALVEFAKNYRKDIDVYRGKEIIRNFETGSEVILKPTLKYSRFPFNFNVCHMATYIRKDAFERFGYYDENFCCAMDRELLFRFHKQGAIEKEINGIYGIFRLGGVSQNIGKRKVEEAAEIIKRYGATKLEVQMYRIYISIKTNLAAFYRRIKND